MNPFDITQFLKMFSNDKNLISTLLATISLTYFAYIVFENFYVDYYWYTQLTGLITMGYLLSFAVIIIYVTIKFLMGFSGGNSMEYHKIADFLFRLYSLIFSFCLLSLFLYFSVILSKQYHVYEILFQIFITIFIIFIILSIKYKEYYILFFTISLMFFIFWFLTYIYLPLVPVSSNLYPPLQGHNSIIMENVYHKNDILIPITIQITGPKTDISINLSKEDCDFKLIQIDTLQTLNPDHNPDKITSSIHSILTGNALNDGGYNIFINTTNLTTGYYELTCSRNTLKSYSVNSFYILDNRSANTLNRFPIY